MEVTELEAALEGGGASRSGTRRTNVSSMLEESISFAEADSSSPSELAPWVRKLQDRLKRVEDLAAFTEAAERKRAAKMLFCGAISGSFGFSFAMLIGLLEEATVGKVDLNGHRFESGRGYFPSTVSELVHDPVKPAGKTFFAFCFVGALFIFFSKYPSQLRNVYIGDDTKCFFGVSWVSYRQFIPAPGMMLLAIITTTPEPQAGSTDEICVMLHLTGAAMLFVGYFITEAHCIGWRCCGRRMRMKHRVLETPAGLQQRQFCLTLIAVFYSIFFILQVMLFVKYPFIKPEDDDQWGTLAGHDGVQLINSAKWSVKVFKVLSYASEVLCGMSLIASHLVIWYHCEERHYNLPEELETLNSRLDLIPNQKALYIQRQRTLSLVLQNSESSDDSESTE